MIDHDRLFKELLTEFFIEFIELFFPEIVAYLEPDSIKFQDKEIFTDVTAGEKYEADLLVDVKFRDQETYFLIHLEHQAQPQANFGRRMFRYFARLYEKFAKPVYPIAIFSYNAPKLPQPNYHRVEFPDKVVLDFNYQLIQLNRLNWRDFLQQHNPVASALMAKMNIAPEDRPRVKSECLRLLATLRVNSARMRMISGFVDTYLQLNAVEEEIFQAEIAKFEPAQQEVVMEIVTSWMQQGIERGLQQGRQEGELAVIMRQLNRRIGTVEPELQERIRQLSLTQLEDLAEALLDFSDVADLAAWLESQGEG
ncbi:Rpn family recombination-promoting nuclease/putative transposase [Coleofasciculus sp. H7-2]|uniref:Rpn family recombination-promoting nuclease/putative transposase n=1 Tax=Coleofasciculus sp. H7-2 TaxID=3351545 RepID=UPI00366E711A